MNAFIEFLSFIGLGLTTLTLSAFYFEPILGKGWLLSIIEGSGFALGIGLPKWYEHNRTKERDSMFDETTRKQE